MAADTSDPYGNINIDLTKIKKEELLPSKPFEKQTEEEKKAFKKQDSMTKSNLKTGAAEDKKPGLSSSKTVSFGKAQTYEVSRESEAEEEESHRL